MGEVRELFPHGPPYDGFVCLNCGETWFELEVLLGKDLRVSGWAGVGSCRGCGRRVEIGGWAHDS